MRGCHHNLRARAGYGRVLLAASLPLSTGHLVGALEIAHNDGPRDHPDNYRKINGLVRYSQGNVINGWAITAMGYHGQWNSTDQVAQRAITSGLIDRFGAIDPTDGGHSYRYSASLDWQHDTSQTANLSTSRMRFTCAGMDVSDAPIGDLFPLQPYYTRSARRLHPHEEVIRMAFIRYLSESELPTARRVPDTDNILQIHGIHPDVMRQHYELYLQLMHRSGPLSRRRREMLGVRVSALNQCQY